MRQDPVVSHRYGVQSCVVPSTFLAVWSPSQVAPETHLLVEASHVLPGAQSVSFVQVALHTAPLHA